MEIVETPLFTEIIQSLMSDEYYQNLQNVLLEKPDSGTIIRNSGGLRKIRWALPGTGKRGGARIIYYWYTSQNQILMIYAYSKNKQEDLTSSQLKVLKSIIE